MPHETAIDLHLAASSPSGTAAVLLCNCYAPLQLHSCAVAALLSSCFTSMLSSFPPPLLCSCAQVQAKTCRVKSKTAANEKGQLQRRKQLECLSSP
eukprot:scaffold1284_cov16-Tisochrysis_lutea.AAC.1